MLHIVLEKPGQFAAIDLPEPAAVPGTALVRVHRIGVCGTDLHAFAGKQPFFTYPRVLGHELGVEVIDPGDEPSGLKVGDRCSVEPYLNCGHCIACRRGKPNCCTSLQVMGVHTDGGMCERILMPEGNLYPADDLSFRDAAMVEFLAIGAHAVWRSEIKPGDRVLVVGAGPIGNGTYHAYINDIFEAGTDLLKIINEILDLSKAEAGKLELLEESVDVASLVRTAQLVVVTDY